MNYRSPLFNFMFGMVAGGVVSTLVAVHAITVRVEEANRRATAANEERVHQLEENWNRQASEAADALNSCTAAGQAMQQDLHASETNKNLEDGWYTFLYEENPQFVPNEQNMVVAAMADLVRPGLGKMITKLAPPSTPQLRLNGVLPGYVRPIVQPANVRFVYTRSPQAMGETFPNGVPPTEGRQ